MRGRSATSIAAAALIGGVLGLAGLGLDDDVMKVPERQNRGVYWNVKVRCRI